MRKGIVAMLVLGIPWAATVQAQVDHCAELLRLSRTSSRTVVDRSQFIRNVENFCDEARSARRDERALNLDLTVLGIGEGGGSEASVNATYAKYCRDTSNERRDELNYQQYLDGIDPAAYGAYAACTSASRDGVQFQLLPLTQREFHLIVSYPSNVGNAEALMSWAAIGPIACQWESFRGDGAVEAEQARTLRANERTRLKCRRDRFDTEPVREPDYVNVIRDGGVATINIPWPKYGSDGNPIPTLAEIADELRRDVQSIRLQLEQRPDRIFGEWEHVVLRQVHQAEADSIIVVNTGGTGSRRFNVRVGDTNVRGEMVIRTRGRAFQGGPRRSRRVNTMRSAWGRGPDR